MMSFAPGQGSSGGAALAFRGALSPGSRWRWVGERGLRKISCRSMLCL